MTMGFRNRRSPRNPRGDMSPTTGRFIVGGVCLFVMSWPFFGPWWTVCLAVPACIGFYQAIRKPEMFE